MTRPSGCGCTGRSATRGSSAIVTIHGGGYLIGTYDMDDALLDRWCPALAVVGISVDYRLAPETAFPGPLEDRYARCAGHTTTPTRSGSTGAHRRLWAQRRRWARRRAVTAHAGSGRGPAGVPASRLPHARRPPDDAVHPGGGAVRVEHEVERVGWRAYLGELYGSGEVPPYAAAARATELSGLPPTCIIVGSIDGFRDEDIDYAQRLNQAGVPCELHVIAGLPHAYLLVPGAAAVQQATRDMDGWLARQPARLGGA